MPTNLIQTITLENKILNEKLLIYHFAFLLFRLLSQNALKKVKTDCDISTNSSIEKSLQSKSKSSENLSIPFNKRKFVSPIKAIFLHILSLIKNLKSSVEYTPLEYIYCVQDFLLFVEENNFLFVQNLA
jgi:hypothetical protein